MSRKTETVESTTASFRLGAWLVEPRLNRLTHDKESLQIELKMMDVLVCLAEHAGELVERQTLIDTVWATEFISENILTRAIAELRSALGDDAKSPSYIETIHRRGYRLMVPVEPVEPAAATVHPFPTRAARPDDERSPYPGLATFTEDEAEFFFGREAEVTQLWRKLTTRRLLAIIGPSGVGKSSLLRAGLVPAAPDGWGVIVCQPGDSPFASLARALAPEFREDPDAIAKLVDIRDVDTAVAVSSRWRGLHDHVLLIVDQFEELFTQNHQETQSEFTVVLRRLADQADVNVLLSMRDDFLIACHDHDSLSPIFSDLTPIKTPGRAALRRALINPAASLGYAFEDEGLVDEMLDAVEGEQGALPLLAFTVARLWQERDRERRIMTREVYDQIGGVHGSLALHAENTLASIGGERHPIVRELFRNLVTAQGTRATREVDDLLSVFKDRAEAAGVLVVLTDARLVNASDVTDDDGGSHHTVEIVHESLLSSWPRLVRWQTQDADAAQLRDELRQAARLWDDHDRSHDFLWTGKAYREFTFWRENYPGGLSEIEEDFSRAMTAHTKRQRQRRRIAAAAGVAMLLAVLAVVTILWQRSERETRRAVAEADRAEASKLLTLGYAAFEEERTRALAYAIASLERSDTPEARRLALKALWAGPPATLLPAGSGAWSAAFSADGKMLAVGQEKGWVRVYQRHGGEPTSFQGFETGGQVVFLAFSDDGARLVASAAGAGGEIRVWEGSEWQQARIFRLPEAPEDLAFGPGIAVARPYFERNGASLFTMTFRPEISTSGPTGAITGRWLVRRQPIAGGSIEDIAELNGTLSPFATASFSRGLVATGNDTEIHLHRLATLGVEPSRVVGRQSRESSLNPAAFDPVSDRLAACDSDGNLALWPLAGDGSRPEAVFKAPGAPMWTDFSPNGRFLGHGSRFSNGWLWDLYGPAGAEPLHLDLAAGPMRGLAFSPDEQWLATASHGLGAAVWTLSYPYSRRLRMPAAGIGAVAFSADGSHLFVREQNGNLVYSWPLSGKDALEPAIVARLPQSAGWALVVDPRGRFLIAMGERYFYKVTLDGKGTTPLEGFPWGENTPAIDPGGRYLATTLFLQRPLPTTVVRDLETNEQVQFEPPGDGDAVDLIFDQRGRLLMTRGGVLSRWDPATGTIEKLIGEGIGFVRPHPDGRRLLLRVDKSADFFLYDPENDSRTGITAHGQIWVSSFDPTGEVLVTTGLDGTIRVGPTLGENPHLLVGHEERVTSLQVSPDGRWIASRSGSSVRLWPMPDVSKPPLHTLPHDELLARLRALTNLRAVPSDASYTGYRVEPDFTAYRGWETVPTW